MTNYKRGVEIERRCMEQLEKVGYTAMRTAGSHGTFDVIAFNKLGVRFIQLKRCKGTLKSFKNEKEEIYNTQLPLNATGEIWVWVDNKGWLVQEVVK